MILMRVGCYKNTRGGDQIHVICSKILNPQDDKTQMLLQKDFRKYSMGIVI